MSKTFAFERFDLKCGVQDNDCHVCGSFAYGGDAANAQSEFDGAWVRAEDAINREEVNADEIRTLKLRLKEAQQRADAANPGEAAMQRACAELPFGYEMQVCLEEGAGWIDLHDPHGEKVDVTEDMDGGMTPRIIDAIECAIEHAKNLK